MGTVALVLGLLAVDAAAAVIAVRGGVVALVVLAATGAVLLVAPAVTALRRSGVTLPRPQVERAKPEVAAAARADGLEFPRALYFLGMLFIGQLTLRPGTPFTISDWLFLAALLSACSIALVTRRRLGYPVPRLLLIGIACFSLGGLISSFTAATPGESIATILRVVYVSLVWFWLGTVVLRTERHVQLAVAIWLVSAAVTGAGAIAQLFLGDVIPGGGVAYGRMTGFTAQFNDLGGVTAVAFVPGLMLVASGGQSPLRRIALLGILGLTGVGLVLSGSVSAFLGASAAVLVWLVAGRARLGSFLVLAVAVAAGLTFFAQQDRESYKSPLERITETTTSRDREQATLRTRFQTYDLAWRHIEQSPLVGVGLDTEGTRTKGGDYYVHNSLLRAWYEAGAVAMIGLALAFLSIVLAGWRTLLRARSRAEANLVTALLAAWIAFGVFSMGQPSLFHRYGWVAGGLLLVVRAQQLRQRVDYPRAA